MKSYKSPWARSSKPLIGLEICYNRITPLHSNAPEVTIKNMINPFLTNMGSKLYPVGFENGVDFPRYWMGGDVVGNKVNTYLITSPLQYYDEYCDSGEGFNNNMLLSNLFGQRPGEEWQNLSKMILLENPMEFSDARTISAKYNYVTREMLDYYFQNDLIDIQYRKGGVAYPISYAPSIKINFVNGVILDTPVEARKLYDGNGQYHLALPNQNSAPDNSSSNAGLKIVYNDSNGNRKIDDLKYSGMSNVLGVPTAQTYTNIPLSSNLFDKLMTNSQQKFLKVHSTSQFFVISRPYGPQDIFYAYPP